MAVTRPGDGSAITKASVETMHNDARTLVNAIPAVGLGVDSLNHEQVPSLLVGTKPLDYLEVNASDTVTITEPFGSDTLADIRANWKELAGYTLDNGGAGYTFPPCKVFAFCCLTITNYSAVTVTSHTNSGAYFVLGREDDDDTGVFHADLSDVGRVFIPQNRTGKALADRYSDMHHTVMITTVIDKTANVGDWVLEKLVIKGASARAGHPDHPTMTIGHGSIGFFAMYRDD
jgi:hypothetical protein